MSTAPIFFLLASLAVLVVEVLIVSFGMLAIVSIGLGVTGIVLAFNESATYGWTMVGITVVAAPLCIRGAFLLLPKLPFARGIYLDKPDLTEEDRHAADYTDRSLLGAEGVTLTPLRPAGSAEFAGEPRDVVTKGVMVDRGMAVKVVDISGNRIIVESIESNESRT